MTSGEADSISRRDVRIVARIEVRWSDVDIYGHVNNVAYYAYVDSAVNGWLIAELNDDIRTLDAIGIVAETSCRYLAGIDFPQVVEIGLATERIGNSAVVYRFVMFIKGDDTVRATGRFVHVYVDRITRTPTAIPETIRASVSGLPSWVESAPESGTR
jgi:acyl-CoA thioester hydrolase